MTQTLEVPGAHLHYEVGGSGPVLLLIPGGAMDGGVFGGMVGALAHDYTVATYDPRGLSRSTLDGPAEDIEVAVQADDAHLLLSAVTSEPAFVFGNSSGATTGLALVAQHPEQVRALVAHEPPLTELLPDSAAHRAAHEELYQTYLGDGPGPANEKYLTYAGLNQPALATDTGPPGPLHPETAAALARIQDNLDLFFAHMLRPITRYVPDAAALGDASRRLVVAAGAESAGQVANRTAVALAGVLDTRVVDFPGTHAGFLRQPQEFARTLHRVFGEMG
jgi:pimeloyl-ACP methyl ester carboxylesterase